MVLFDLFHRLRGLSTLKNELRGFFGCNPAMLPIVKRKIIMTDLPNLQLAIASWTESRKGTSKAIGYTAAGMKCGLIEMIGGLYPAYVSAPQYRSVYIAVDRQMKCLENGIHLVSILEHKLAVHVHIDQFMQIKGDGFELEVMSQSAERSEAFIEEIRQTISKQSIYRGKILSLESEGQGCGGKQIRFHSLPRIRREDIILPENILKLIERNTVGFLRNAETLRRAGRAVKRGLLLHGKPGTGKTFTAKWLAQAVEGLTVILMSGEQLWLIKECCQLARMLAPALVVMEDVDLIATERSEDRHPAYQITLHQLLNEMDGLAASAEIIFLLTTNRPEAIEKAIAARPGRIDQAIEFPLPDAACRQRLFDLYFQGLASDSVQKDRLIERTEGASPAFIQELVRKAALFAAEENAGGNGTLRVTQAHFDSAMKELVLGGGELTRNLLGFASAK